MSLGVDWRYAFLSWVADLKSVMKGKDHVSQRGVYFVKAVIKAIMSTPPCHYLNFEDIICVKGEETEAYNLPS